MIAEAQIAELLVLGGLDVGIAQARAPLVREFFLRTGIPFLPSITPPFELPNGRTIHLVRYDTGDTRHSVENAEVPTFEIVRPPKLKEMGGSELEKANLCVTSKVCEIGTAVLKTDWPEKFLTRLRNPTAHLDVLNEVWWLARFPGIAGIPRKACLRIQDGIQEDVDWQFQWNRADGSTVNLEVKRRINDLVRGVHGTPLKNPFQGAISKFRRSSSTELNILALTLYANIDAEVKRQLDDFIRFTDMEGVIDAFVICSVFSKTGETLFIRHRAPKAIVVKSCLHPPDEEDLNQVMLVSHPVSMREAIERARQETGIHAAAQPAEDSGS